MMCESMPLPTSPVLFMNKAYHFIYRYASEQALWILSY